MLLAVIEIRLHIHHFVAGENSFGARVSNSLLDRRHEDAVHGLTDKRVGEGDAGIAQRGREFGIRQALGADRSSILSLVLKQGLLTAGIGIVLGLIGSVIVSRFMQTMLFGVGQHDPAVFAGVTIILFVVAAAACYIPARRATKVDPIVALRES